MSNEIVYNYPLRLDNKYRSQLMRLAKNTRLSINDHINLAVDKYLKQLKAEANGAKGDTNSENVGK